MSDIFAPVGFRSVTLFALNSDGRINAESEEDPYEGLSFAGPKAYNLTQAAPRNIVHTGKDSVIAQDQLPSLEADTAEILASAVDLDIDAFLQNVKKVSLGGASIIGRASDQRGYEPYVGVLLYQQSKDVITGARNWHFHIIPSTQAIPIAAQWNDTPNDHRYSLSPSQSSKDLFGITNTLAVRGLTRAGIWDGIMDHKPVLFGYLGDGIADVFVFPSHLTMADANYAVIVNGVEVTSGIIKTETGIDFDGYPPTGDVNIFGGLAN